jgi:hypothetical protein
MCFVRGGERHFGGTSLVSFVSFFLLFLPSFFPSLRWGCYCRSVFCTDFKFLQEKTSKVFKLPCTVYIYDVILCNIKACHYKYKPFEPGPHRHSAFLFACILIVCFFYVMICQLEDSMFLLLTFTDHTRVRSTFVVGKRGSNTGRGTYRSEVLLGFSQCVQMLRYYVEILLDVPSSSFLSSTLLTLPCYWTLGYRDCGIEPQNRSTHNIV